MRDHNDLVRSVTAFNSYDALVAELHSGYVPTLRVHEGDSDEEVAAIVELRAHLASLGWRVYPEVIPAETPELRLITVRKLTQKQVYVIEDEVSMIEEGHESTAADIRATVVTMPAWLWEGVIDRLEGYDWPGGSEATTDAQADFAERAFYVSIYALVGKIHRALGNRNEAYIARNIAERLRKNRRVERLNEYGR